MTPREPLSVLVASLRAHPGDQPSRGVVLRLLDAVQAGGRLYDAADETERAHGGGCQERACVLRRAAMAAWRAAGGSP